MVPADLKDSPSPSVTMYKTARLHNDTQEQQNYTMRPNKKETRFISSIIFIATQDLIKLYASSSRAFSLLSFDTKYTMISQCMTEKEQLKLMHVKIDLRRIMVLSWYDQVQNS